MVCIVLWGGLANMRPLPLRRRYVVTHLSPLGEVAVGSVTIPTDRAHPPVLHRAQAAPVEVSREVAAAWLGAVRGARVGSRRSVTAGGEYRITRIAEAATS